MATSIRVLVAYDGSPHAGDALALGRQLAEIAGTRLELAHVDHTVPVQIGGEQSHAGRERFLSHRSEGLLAAGAKLIGESLSGRQHVVSASTTATGLRELAEQEAIDVIVFGSSYNAPADRVHPGSAARRLLQNGPSALAFAPPGYRARADGRFDRVAFAQDDTEESARQTAEAIAARSDGTIVEAEAATLVVIGSRAQAPEGHVQITPAGERTIHSASAPVLVVPRAVALDPAGVLVAA